VRVGYSGRAGCGSAVARPASARPRQRNLRGIHRALQRAARAAAERAARSPAEPRALGRFGDGAARMAAQARPPRPRPRAAAGAALLLALGGAEAGTINVTPKTPPGLVTPDGRCSLSEAIISANNGSSLYGDCPGASGGPNTINVAGTQTLTTYYDYYNGYNT